MYVRTYALLPHHDTRATTARGTDRTRKFGQFHIFYRPIEDVSSIDRTEMLRCTICRDLGFQ